MRAVGPGGTGGKDFLLTGVSGAAYKGGVQHGRACGDLLRRYPAILRRLSAESAESELDDAELGRRAMRFLPAIEQFAPDQVEEIRGIAAGAEVPCGAVEAGVLGGEPGPLDSVLSEEGRRAGDCMMICVSRSCTPRLVLDL